MGVGGMVLKTTYGRGSRQIANVNIVWSPRANPRLVRQFDKTSNCITLPTLASAAVELYLRVFMASQCGDCAELVSVSLHLLEQVQFALVPF
jgi:hypothetical protein